MVAGRINKRLKSAKRAQEILGVLLKYGFQDVVYESGIDRWLSAGKKLDHVLQPESVVSRLPKPVRFRKSLEELGPTAIKIGQILSTRPDLIDPAIAEELTSLHSSCPAVSFDKVEELLESEFAHGTSSIFANIEQTAFAAGSLAQVHRATLLDGSKVVLKILKPGVRGTLEADIEIISALAQLMERYFQAQGYSLTEVVQEFARQAQREVDLIHEGRATERFAKYFAKDSRLLFPKVYWNATTRNVLAMQEIPGQILSELPPSSFSKEDAREMVRLLSDAVLKQCFEFGYFHADPHPGNLFLLEGGRLAFIDCGMTGHLDKRTSEQLAQLLSGAASSDIDKVISSVLSLAEADPFKGEDRVFRQDTAEFIAIFEQSTLKTLRVGEMLDSLFRLLQKHRVRCPTDLVYLIKAVTTLEGVAEAYDPSFDVVSHIHPYLEALIRRRYTVEALGRRFRKTVVSYAELLEILPETLLGIVAQIRGNRFRVALEHSGLNRLTDTIQSASQNIAFALIAAALLIASSILVRAAPTHGGLLHTLGLTGLACAVGFSLMIILGNYRKRRK